MATAIESIGIRTTGIHHAALRTSDLARARVFYVVRLGFPLLEDGADRFVFSVGQSAITVLATADAASGGGAAIRAPGLDCIALGCEEPGELRRVAAALGAAGIEHSGVRADAGGKEYVGFTDPDGIAWKLCMV